MTPLDLPVALLVVLVVVAFVSGIGITTIGPGGIFVTIALFSLTPLSSAEVAGTAHLLFIATGILGSAAYLRSGEMTSGPARVMVLILCGSCIIGAIGGSVLNHHLEHSTFGALLGLVTIAVGVTMLYRQWRGLLAVCRLDVTTRGGQLFLALVGVFLGLASGLLGVGGPVLAVPTLVLLGVPMLLALAIAQVQSIIIATAAASGYLYYGSLSLAYAGFVGGPLLAGVLVGWLIAHRVEPNRLTQLLGIVMIVLGLLLLR